MTSTPINPEKTAALLELLPKIAKFTAIVGTLCGFFYLFAYVQDAGIPFPLQLNVLPLTLLVIGLSAFGGVIILAGGVVVPAILADDPLEVTKDFLLSRDATSSRHRTRIYRWFMCVMMPMLLSLTAVTVWLSEEKGKSTWLSVLALIFAAVAIFWIPLTAVIFRALRSKWVQYSLSTLFQTVLAVWAYTFLIILIVAAKPTIAKWSAWEGCLVALAIFSPIYFLVTFPPEGSRSTLILLPPNYEYRAAPSTAIAIGLALVAAVISTFAYPINARIGNTVLKVFRIGGRIPIILCLKDPPNKTISQQIPFDANNCSEKLVLLFDGGDRIFLNQVDAGTETAKSGIPFSIRQEDVLVKKYPDL
jgi:hypothetical protein